MPDLSNAYYFAILQYTTVGSSFTLPFHWRGLEGALAMTGLLTFAWSTGVLMTIAEDFQRQQLLIQRRHHNKAYQASASSTHSANVQRK